MKLQLSYNDAFRADRLFKEGLSTKQIAKDIGCREHHALKLINVARAQRLGQPDPYKFKGKKK